ncbi:conserved hypothetical protein [Coccidioides posadasii str. Silveira]|uniref:Uncharacterized protein n=1 Tax=Coccidioides posadasii (strain RMSCC 757 / Silveira) TaxID=443226 RepID=E9D6I3_COCPS|nr:conserved hypothetical protein [Coccidioides posadasii str. Silveira]
MANAKWASTFVFVSHITGILGAWLLRFDFRIRNMCCSNSIERLLDTLGAAFRHSLRSSLGKYHSSSHHDIARACL